MYPLRKLLFVTVAAVLVCAVLFYARDNTAISVPLQSDPQTSSHLSASSHGEAEAIIQSFIVSPVQGPDSKNQFGELGQRIQALSQFLSVLPIEESKGDVAGRVEQALTTQFPWLKSPSVPNDRFPFHTLRQSFIKASRGIVIASGSRNLRFTAHLITTIRNVVHSELPIQIAYAGELDLPTAQREMLQGLSHNVSCFDVLSIFSDEPLNLARGGWAIKPFALLGSTFEEVILLDADAVFLQAPDRLFSQKAYLESGALFFHDRLLWQHGFKERHQWWKEQMAQREPSRTLMKSLVWTEDYAEEADTGVVVINKSRLSTVMGLLHVCWQNQAPLRDDVTYRMGYGDKETWWFGLELSGVPYAFESHYGSMVGWKRNGDHTRVCSFTIAHLDEDDKLFWLNGSLLKNKAVDSKAYEVPTSWMMDATWEKGRSKPEMSCTKDGLVRELSTDQIRIFQESIDMAKALDSTHKAMFGLN